MHTPLLIFFLFKRKTRKHSGQVKHQQVSDWIAAVWMRFPLDPAVCVPTACSGQWLSDSHSSVCWVDGASLSCSAQCGSCSSQIAVAGTQGWGGDMGKDLWAWWQINEFRISL